jgi:hypothetical protein
MPLRFFCRPAADLVQPKLTAGSCRRACDGLVNGACVCLLYRMRLPAGVEREHVDATARELLLLGHWFARLVEEK